MPEGNWLFLTTPHKQNLKYAFCFKLDNEILPQQQKNNKFGNSHVSDDVITLVVACEDILWQMLFCCRLAF